MAQIVHQLHDVEGLVEGHVGRFSPAVGYGFLAGEELVLVASDLLGDFNLFYEHTVTGIYFDGLRIVDVVDDKVALRTTDGTLVVVDTAG